MPLIVDEAHGGHFAFLPEGSPEPALAAGADIVIQSWHKTVGSLVGSAMLHVGHNSPVEPTQVRDALNFLQTTSPSYLLMASLDLVRRRMAREGQRLFAQAVEDAKELEQEIERLPGLRVLRPESDPRMAGHQRDPLRLVVNVAGTGWTGYDFEKYLRTEFQVEDEMSDWSSVVYILSPQDDPAAKQRLLAGLRSISESAEIGVGDAPARGRRIGPLDATDDSATWRCCRAMPPWRQNMRFPWPGRLARSVPKWLCFILPAFRC